MSVFKAEGHDEFEYHVVPADGVVVIPRDDAPDIMVVGPDLASRMEAGDQEALHTVYDATLKAWERAAALKKALESQA